MDNASEQKKEKIKSWLKDKNNLAFLAIIIFTIIIRVHYLLMTKTQPLWWDEAEYMSGAKSYAGIIDFHIGSIRMPGYSMIASLFFMLGITNELALRFFLAFLPGVIVVIASYFCIKEMYPDKRIAVISTLIIAVLWENLFFSSRFHTDNPALIFELLAIFVLFKGYLKKEDFHFIKAKHSLYWVALFTVLCIFMRAGDAMFVPAIFIFFIWINKAKVFTKKYTLPLIGLLIVFIAAVFFVAQAPKTGILIYLTPLENNPVAWNSLSIFNGFYESVVPLIPSIFFYAFLFGLVVFIFDLFMFYGDVKKISRENVKENIDRVSDAFNFILLLSVMLFFIFIIRPTTGYELRWFFPLALAMLVFTSKGIITFSQYIGMMFNKKAVGVIIIILVACGIYTQLAHADQIIKIKLDSYSQIKDSALWIKENSDKTDTIIAASVMQYPYYAERTTYGIPQTEEELNKLIQEKKPRFLVLTLIQPTSDWSYNWPQKNNETAIPVQAYTMPGNSKQAILIVYEMRYQN